MRDHHGPAQAEQDGSAVAVRVQPRGQLPQAAALQERADAGGPGGGHRGAQLGGGEPDRALQRLQRHVPGEAVGHDHVDLARQQIAALHVARETQRERAVRRVAGQQFVRAPGELVALARFGADGQQPHPGGGHAQRGLRVGHAELAELDEHLRLGIGGRARVDEHGAAGAGRQHDGEPGSFHPGQRPQPQPGDGHDGAGGAGRHHRGRFAAPDQLARHRHARPGAAQAGQRALVHRQVVLGRHDLDLVDGAQPAEQLAQPGGRPGQHDPDVVLALGRERPGHDRVWGVIPAHGVDRDQRARCTPLARRAVSMASRVSVVSHVSRVSHVCVASHVCGASRICGASRAPGVSGAPRLGLAVPRREPPVRAFGHGTQRITGVRGRGWCLIPAVPLNLQCRPGGPIMARWQAGRAWAPCPAPAGGRSAPSAQCRRIVRRKRAE